MTYHVSLSAVNDCKEIVSREGGIREAIHRGNLADQISLVEARGDEQSTVCWQFLIDSAKKLLSERCWEKDHYKPWTPILNVCNINKSSLLSRDALKGGRFHDLRVPVNQLVGSILIFLLETSHVTRLSRSSWVCTKCASICTLSDTENSCKGKLFQDNGQKIGLFNTSAFMLIVWQMISLPVLLDVNGHVALVSIQDADLCRMGCAPYCGLKLWVGCCVAWARHIEALGVIVDRVCALQPQYGMLLVSQSTCPSAA